MGLLTSVTQVGQLEPYTGGLEIKWPSKMAPKLSLRETVKKEYPSLLLGDRCHCKTGCTTHRCTCRADGRPCLAHCHSGSNCANKEDKNGSNSTHTALYMTKLLISHKVQSRTPKVVGLEHHRLQLQSGTHGLLCTNNMGAIGVSIILIIPQSHEEHYCKWSRKAGHTVWTRYCPRYAFVFS